MIHSILESIEGVCLAVAVIAPLAALIALPFYGIYRLINKGLSSLMGWVLCSWLTLIYGIVAVISSIVYCMPQADYGDAAIFLVLGVLGINFGLYYTQGVNLTTFSLRSKLHLINIFIAICVCAGFLIYDFSHLSLPELSMRTYGLLYIIIFFMLVHVLPWFTNVIYFGWLGCFNKNFFKFEFTEIYLAPKILYYAVIPESIDVKHAEQWIRETINIMENNVNEDESYIFESSDVINTSTKETISQYNLLEFRRDWFELEVTSRHFTTAPLVSEQNTDETPIGIIMPKGQYMVYQFEGPEFASRDFLRIFYIWVSLTYPSIFPKKRTMFVLNLDPQTSSTVRLRAYVLASSY